MVNIGTSNIPGIILNLPRWFIFNIYPFQVLNKEEFRIELERLENLDNTYWNLNKGIYNSFNRRIDAEKYRLTNCMEYYAYHNDTNNYMITANEFNNIELLHPEWLI